jgi:chemotaxis protein histidine kinase CheA
LPEPAAPAEPAAPDELALPGSECWSKCDEKAGKCPQFCANPPFWMGSCCRLDATEEGQSPDCTNRGCVGSHCCVADSSGSGETPEEIEAAMEDTQRQMNEDAEKAMAAEAKAAETASKEAEKVEKQAEKVERAAEKEQKEAERQNAAEAQSDAEATAATDALDPSKADPGLFSNHETDQDKRSIANWTRNDLRDLYVHARPSNNLSQVGLMVHCFDGTEDWTQPWAPCLEGECVEGQEKMNFVRWWSVSIINQQQPHTLATSGLILTPQHNEILCSWDSDFGSMLSGCKVHNVHPLPPDKLKDMLDVSMSPNNAKMFGDSANTYNEVLVNSTYFWQQMPQSIAAFVYFDDEAALQAGQGQDLRLPDKIVAVTNYVKLLDYYKLSERDLPLLKVNRSGLTFEDVSFGARKFLANHSYETYRKQNPYRKANPPAKVVKTGNGTAITVDGALPTRQAGQEQQLAQERQAEAIGTNERVVSGELLKCRKLSSEQIIWNDRPCSRQKLVRSSKRHRAVVTAPVI